MKAFIFKLLSLLTRHDRKFLLVLLGLSIFVSLIEAIGVTAILPFITVAGDFSVIQSNPYYRHAYELFGFATPVNFVIAFGAALLLFYFLRSLINLGYLYLLAKFAKGRYHLLAYRLFENYLGMSYRQFIEKNSSELNKAIINEANNLTTLLAALLLMLSEIFVVVFIYALMLYINWKITLLISTILFLNAILLIKTVSSRIKAAGADRELHQKAFYEIINSSLGNFKMMKLTSHTDKIMERFDQASQGYARANILNETLGHFPRLFLEAVGFGIVVFMVIYLVFKYQTDISHAMALISMFVLGLYRLMPSANRILHGYNQILFHRKSLDIVHNDLMYDPEVLEEIPVVFTRDITLSSLSFGYNEKRMIIRGIDLTLHKGEKIAFIGESGSGKSTLIDLIIGLYRPHSGSIKIDGTPLDEKNIRQWRRMIGYIPQSVYLFDGSVADNVAFGAAVDREKVKTVLRQANILAFLEEHQKGVDTVVGENGIKLSGGQKQRIAIARALYNNPELLVLDEATSALDGQTEAAIMKEIYALCRNKTLIIIAHRLSTIENCDRIYRLNNGMLHDA